MTHRQNPDNPGTSKCTDAKCTDDHGDDRVSDTTKGTGQYFDTGIYKVEYTQEMHHVCPNCNDCRVIHKKRNTPGAQHIDAETADDGKAKAHQLRGSNAFVYAFHFAGTEILPHKGCDCGAKCIDPHPVYSVNLIIDRPGCNGIGTDSVKTDLNNGVGKTVHHADQTRRKPDSDHIGKNTGIQRQFLPFKPIAIRCIMQHMQDQTGTDHLCQNSCRCCTKYSHVEGDDEKNVKNRIQDTADHEISGRAFGIPDRPEYTGTDVKYQITKETTAVYAKIGDGHFHGIFRCFHPYQNRWCKYPSCDT